MAKTNLKREQTIIRCEDYMLRGYDRPSELSQLLGVAYNTAKEYIQIVRARWQLQGDPLTRESARSELVKKAQEVIKESWALKSNTKNNMEKISAMRVILHAIERLTKLQGLDTNSKEDMPIHMSLEIQRHNQVFLLAEQLNQLPPAEKAKAKEMIKAEIKKRKSEKSDKNNDEKAIMELPGF